MEKYKLLFYKKASEFIGTLKLFKLGRFLMKWQARSGQPGVKSYWSRGISPIPPSSDIKGNYKVNFPGYTPGYRNAMGDWCYHITPDPVTAMNGNGARSELCIHSDANFEVSPGSAGCIVLHPDVWLGFRRVMDDIAKQEKNKAMPLEVVYG